MSKIEVEDQTTRAALDASPHSLTVHLHIEETPDLCVAFKVGLPDLDPCTIALALSAVLAQAADPEVLISFGDAVAKTLAPTVPELQD